MTAVEIASLLKESGPWGLIALLMVVVVYQHRGWQACQDQALKDRERLICVSACNFDPVRRGIGVQF